MDVIWCRLCKYDLRKGDLFVLSSARVGKYLFRAANV